MKVKNADEFYKILERKAIYPVFQPIVNLQTGDVAGYEALSRIDRHDTTLMISDLFVSTCNSCIAEQFSDDSYGYRFCQCGTYESSAGNFCYLWCQHRNHYDGTADGI